MRLEFLKGDQCPICGTPIIMQESVEPDGERLLQHTNGGKWEKRKFICGLTLEYVPNFQKTYIAERSRCSHDPSYKEIVGKREQARKTVIDFIQDMSEADEYLKQIMVERLQAMNIDYVASVGRTEIK